MPEELTIRIRAEGGEQVQRALSQIQKNLQSVGATVRVVSRNASSAFSSFAERLNALSEGMEKVSSGLKNFGESARRFGTIMTATVGGSIALATKNFMDFETRLAEIQTIARVSQSQLEQMGRQIRQVAVESAQSFDTTARALYQILSAGVPVSESMKVLRASAKLAAGGLADLESTADAVTTVLNAYRMSADKANKVADVMFKTVELGKTTVPELAAQIGRVASTAAQAGISFEELSAAVAAMTAAGVRTEMAMSSLGQLLQNLLNPNKALTEALQKLGYSSGLALLQAKGLAGALEVLSKAIPREQLAEMIGSVEGLRAVMVLTGSQGDRFREMLEKMKNSAGAADQAFKTISQTASFQFRQALSSVQNALIELGAAFAPALGKIAQSIKNVLDQMQKSGQIQQMRQDLQQLADDFGKALAGAIEKAATVMEKFNKLAPETRRKIMELVITFGPLTFAVGTLAGALSKIIDLFAKVGRAIAWLINNVPAAASAIAAFVSKIPPWLRAGGIYTAVLAGVAELRGRIEGGESTALGKAWLERHAQSLRERAEVVQQRMMQDFVRMGQKVSESVASGIQRGKGHVGKAADEMANEVRKRLPKSPPEVGPLKDIVEAGIKIPQLIADGIKKGGKKAVEAMEELAGYLMTTWNRFMRRFEILGEIRVARARAAGRPEAEVLGLERQMVLEELGAAARVVARMRQLRRKGVPIPEEDILEVELRIAQLQERLAEIAERRKELAEREKEMRYQQYMHEAEMARMLEEMERYTQRELRGPAEPVAPFPPVEGLPDFERAVIEETQRAMAEIEAFGTAQRLMAQVARELEGLPQPEEIFPPVPPLPEMDIAERPFQLAEAQAELLRLQIEEIRTGKDLSAQRNEVERRILKTKVVDLENALKVAKTAEERVKILEEILEAERRMKELAEPQRRTKASIVEGFEEIAERLPERMAAVISGRGEIGDMMRDLVRDIQEAIAKELLQPLTDTLKRVLNGLASQLSASIGAILGQLPKWAQLGLGGLALVGGLRPITEAVEGVGKFVTHTVGEVLKVFGIRIGGKKKSASSPVVLGTAVYGPSINLNTAVTLQVDGRELGRVLVRQVV